MTQLALTAGETAQSWYECWFSFEELYALWAKRSGLNRTLLFCLHAVRACDGIPSPGRVADFLHLSKQTVNSALEILESKGYITRRINPLNRRARQIFLTAQGERLSDEVIADLHALEDRIFGKLSQRDRKALMRLMRQLIDNLRLAVET